MSEVLLIASRPVAAPAASLGMALLLLAVPSARRAFPIDLAAAAALAVLVLALLGRGSSAALRTDDASYGFACAIALVGFAATSGLERGASTRELTGARLRLLRFCPPAITGLAMLAVRFADPSLAIGALFGSATVACCVAALARGPEAAASAFRLLIQVVLAASFCLVAQLLLLTVGGTGGALLLLAIGLLAFTTAAPFGAALGGAASRVPTGLAPLLLLATPIAASSLLFRTVARLHALPGLGTAGVVLLFASAIVGLLDAGRSRPERADAQRPASFFLSLALASVALGGRTGFLAALLALATAAVVVPAHARAGNRVSVRIAAASLPPFGGAVPLALSLDRAAAVSPVLAVLLGAAALSAMRAMLRRIPPDAPPLSGQPSTLTVAALILLLVIGFALPAGVSDAIVASADALAQPR